MEKRVLLPLKLMVLPVWLLAGATPSAHAQDSQVSGQILDSTRSAVPLAQVTLTRTDTGEQRETFSNHEGYYIFPLLFSGPYDLEVEKRGFKTETQTNIEAETGAISTVDVTLAVGALSQNIVVKAVQGLLQTETSSISHVVEHQAIVDLPLIDRRSEQLLRLNGFVVQNGSGGNATFAIAGGRGDNANYYIDGGTAQNLALGVPSLIFDPPVEAMQEFNVAISTYSAELGRSGGGVVQMTTRSGTNQFHGSAYEYFRNDALDARTFFSSTVPTLRYNLFGVSLGGPIQKDRTQFFFNYEGRRQTAVTTEILSVPTLSEDHGDFSADSFKVMDPSTCIPGNPPVCQPFANNVIPPQSLDPVGAKLAAFYPAPNLRTARPGAANFVANDPTYSPYNSYVGRVDRVFTGRNHVFGRLLAQTGVAMTASIFPTPGTDSFGRTTHMYYYNASASWDHTFSPYAMNELRYTYTRGQGLNIAAGAHTTLTQQIGLKNVDTSFFPSVVVQGLASLGGPQQRLQSPIRSGQYADNVTMIRRDHVVKFGFEYRYAANLDIDSPSPAGTFSFNNTVTKSSLASLLLGRVQAATLQVSDPLHTRADSHAAFVQDSWRAAPNLTLNLGMRWDADSPRWETNNRQDSFSTIALNPVSRTAGTVLFSGRNGVSKYANDWDLDNFGPRVGFAWRPAGQWVVRGGGGILYPGEYDSATPINAALGFAKEGSFVSSNNGITPAFRLADGMPPISAPTASQLTPGFGAVLPPATPITAVQFFGQSRRTGYLYQTSLDVQRQFGKNWLVDLGYVGTFGHHLAAPDLQSINQVPPDKLAEASKADPTKPLNTQILRPFPQYSNVQLIAADIGNSNYNGLNLGVEKRYSAGLSLTANYTYSQFIDNLDSRNELANYPGQDAFTNYYNQGADKGRSGNDITHRVVVSSIYQLPAGHGRRFAPRSALVDGVVGGWTIGLIAGARSGTPLSPIELMNNTFSFSDGVRPNVVGNPNLPGSRPLGDKLMEWFNVKAFTAPPSFTFGNAGRTFGEGPGAVTLDASLLKNWRIREGSTVEFRAEVLNLMNHPNFANPDTRQDVVGTFGEITSLMPGNQSRIIQLGLRLEF